MSAGRILVVDDHPSNLKLVRVILECEGFEVQTAQTGVEAMAHLAGFRPELVLMDLQLPGMDGFELTRRIKADPATRGVVVVAATAYAMKGDRERAMEAGCDGYLAKPLDTRRLAATLAAHLEGYSSQRPQP